MTIGRDARVVSIHASVAKGQPLVPLTEASLVVGQGLMGDRRFSLSTKASKQVTLIEEEALAAAAEVADFSREALAGGATRRNVVTRHVALNHLVGRRFRVGTAVLEGVELCEPCGHLARCTSRALEKALVHRGGLRCAVVESGLAHPGDPILDVL